MSGPHTIRDKDDNRPFDDGRRPLREQGAVGGLVGSLIAAVNRRKRTLGMTDMPGRQHWFQFSLRTFSMLVLLAGISMAWFGKRFQQAQEQQQAAKAIMTLGGHVYYDYQFDEYGDLKDQAHPPGPPWVRSLTGDDFFADLLL